MRHYGQRHRADRLPLAADGVDVRGRRTAPRKCARASSRACRRGASASPRTWLVLFSSWRRRRRTSIPVIPSTPTAAILRDERLAGKARIGIVGAGLMGHGIAAGLRAPRPSRCGLRRGAGSAREPPRRIEQNLADLGQDTSAAERVRPEETACGCGRRCRCGHRGGAREARPEAGAFRGTGTSWRRAGRSLPATPRSFRSARSRRGSTTRDRVLGTHWWNPP